MPVTRADATPPLLYPAVLSAEHYVTLTVAINLVRHVRIYTHGRRDERRGTRSCKEVARGGSFVENEARHELALNAGERGKREAAPECRARVDGAVVSIFFFFFFLFSFSTAPPCSTGGAGRLAAPRLALFFPRIMYVLGARVAFRGGVVRVRPVVPPVINNLET